jgi:hypothetical protein
VPREGLSVVRQPQPDTGAAKATSAPMAGATATPASTVTWPYSPSTRHLVRANGNKWHETILLQNGLIPGGMHAL